MASAAVRMSNPDEYVTAQGKNWMIMGDLATSAAFMKPMICSMLYAIAAITPYLPFSAAVSTTLLLFDNFQFGGGAIAVKSGEI